MNVWQISQLAGVGKTNRLNNRLTLILFIARQLIAREIAG